MIAGLLLLGIVGLAAGAGRTLLRLFQLSDLSAGEELLCSVALGLGAFSYATLGLGVLGLLYRGALVALLIAAAAVAAFEARGIAVRVATVARQFNWPSGMLSRALLVLLAATALLGAIATLAPISSADALSYHFAAPKIWLHNHRIANIPWDWHTHQPMTVEMLYLLGMRVYSDILGSLFHWCFGVLLLGFIALLHRRITGETDWMLPASVFYVSALIAWESSSGFVELGLAFFATAALYGFFRWREANDTRWLALCGVFAGLAAGCKITGGFVVVLLAAMVAARLLRKGTATTAKSLLVFGVLAGTVVLPWLMINFVQTGDPVYPFLSLSRHPGIRQQLQATDEFYGYGRSLREFVLLPFRMTFQGAKFDSGQFLGPLYLAFIPFAVPLARRKSSVAWLFGFTAGFVVLWFLGTRQVRFLVPVLPAAALLTGIGIAQLMAAGKAVRNAAVAVVLVALGWNAVLAGTYDSQFLGVVLGRQSAEDFLSRKTWFQSDIAWMNQNLPGDARVLMLANMGYYMDRDYLRWEEELPERVAIAARLRADHVSDVYCPEITDPGCQAVMSAVPYEIAQRREHIVSLHRTMGNLSGVAARTSVVLHLGPGMRSSAAEWNRQ